ncbi:MAG: hypothetical protein MHMPM18_000468 [Marteilia pararefringens]
MTDKEDEKSLNNAMGQVDDLRNYADLYEMLKGSDAEKTMETLGIKAKFEFEEEDRSQ